MGKRKRESVMGETNAMVDPGNVVDPLTLPPLIPMHCSAVASGEGVVAVGMAFWGEKAQLAAAASSREPVRRRPPGMIVC